MFPSQPPTFTNRDLTGRRLAGGRLGEVHSWPKAMNIFQRISVGESCGNNKIRKKDTEMRYPNPQNHLVSNAR